MFSMCAGRKLLLLQINWQATGNDNIPAISPFHHIIPWHVQSMLVDIFISLFISWWQGKMVFKVTQTHGTTEGHWVWNMSDGIVASWVLKEMNNLLFCFKSTRWDRILWTNYLWDCILYNNMEKLFFIKRLPLCRLNLPFWTLCVFLPQRRAQWKQCPGKWNAHSSLSEFMQLVWQTNLFLAIGDYH